MHYFVNNLYAVIWYYVIHYSSYKLEGKQKLKELIKTRIAEL